MQLLLLRQQLRWYLNKKTSQFCQRKLRLHTVGEKGLGLPYKIGCGLGGGDWNKVKEIIENFALNHPNINIIIYEPL